MIKRNQKVKGTDFRLGKKSPNELLQIQSDIDREILELLEKDNQEAEERKQNKKEEKEIKSS